MKFLLIPILICGVLGDNFKYEPSAWMKDLIPINCYGNTKSIPNTSAGAQTANLVTDASSDGHSHAWWWDATIQRPCFVRATYNGPGPYTGKHPIMVTVMDLTIGVPRSTVTPAGITKPPHIIEIKLLDVKDDSTQTSAADWGDNGPSGVISASSKGITDGTSVVTVNADNDITNSDPGTSGFCDTMAGGGGANEAEWGTRANKGFFHLGAASDNTDADGCKAPDGLNVCNAHIKHKQKCVSEIDGVDGGDLACIWEGETAPRGWCSPVIATLPAEVYAPTIQTSNGDTEGLGWAEPADGGTASLNPKIDNKSYLYWNFQVADGGLESGTVNATRVYFVLGSAGDGAGGGVADSGITNGHLVFMFQSDDNTPAQTADLILNDTTIMAVGGIWLVKMKENTPAGQVNMATNTWINGTGAKVIDAYISTPTSTDCDEDQCPANVFGTETNNYDNGDNRAGTFTEGLTPAGLTQAWVAVTLPVCNNDAITKAFYILSCAGTGCTMTDSVLNGIRGTTYIPEGICTKTAACNLSFFSYDVGPVDATPVVADGIMVCAWPSGIPCTDFQEFSSTADKNVSTDVWVATELSSTSAIETINNAPVVNNTTRGHIYAEHDTTTKGYLTLATNDNAKNYPILIQANNNSQRGEDIRGWMSEVVEFKDQTSPKPLHQVTGDASCETGILGNCDDMVDQITDVNEAEVAATGGAYIPDLAGGTEYPAAFRNTKAIAGGGVTCSGLLSRGCGAYGSHKGTMQLRALWPHAWKLAGFQFVSTTYRQFKINEFSHNFNSNLQPALVNNAMSRATVWGTDGATAATTPADYKSDTAGLYKFQGLFQWQPNLDNDRLWRIYMQEPTTGSTVPKKIFTQQKLVGVREFLKTTLPVAGATYIKDVRMSTGNAPALATTNDWGTGDAIRSVTAYQNYGDLTDAFSETDTTSGTTFDYAPKYTFTSTYGRKLGISLDSNTNNQNAGGRIFLVNKNRIINRVLGSCDRPAWHDNDADSATGGVPEFGSTENYDTIATPASACLGLGTVTHCALFALSGSLVAGEYEVWYQHLNNSMPYLQTDSTANIEVKAYDTDKFDFIDSATMCVGAANCVAPALTFDNEFGTNDTVVVKFSVNANAVTAHDDMVGYIVYFETTGVSPPTSIDRKDVIADGPYDRWIRNCYGVTTQTQARTKDQLTTTANIRACIAHHGNGTYYVYVQIDGAKKYVKQSSSFTVAFAAAYLASGTNLVKQITFKNVTAQVEAVGPPAVAAADGEYLFDDMERNVCNRYASRGSKKGQFYNANNANMPAMEVKLKAGVGGIHSTTQCYLRLYKDITCTDPVDTPNGQSPIGVAQVFDPITATLLSGACQSANTADMTDNDETTNNHYQIPPVVAKQLGPNMCIRLYSRLNNGQWALQADDSTKLVLNGYTAQASATLVSKFTFVTAVTDITSAIGGTAISFSVNIPSPEAVTGNSQDTLRVCIKPVLSGTQNDFFIRYYDSRTTFCTVLPAGTGADQTVSKTWSTANASGAEEFYPGSYELYAKWEDINSPASQVSNYCEKMTKQSVGTIPILWTIDAGVTTAVAWAAEDGISTADTVPAAGWASSMAVTNVKTGVAKTTLLKYSGANIEPYRVNITYQLPIYPTGSYQLYWSKGTAADDLCNCSLNRCSLLHTNDDFPANSTNMVITTGQAYWPSVGKPGCQFSNRTYATDFPETGKYYLCVNKTITNKGNNITVAVGGTPTNVSLHINPSPSPTTGPTAATAAVSPAMRITTIISAIIAVIGVLML